MVLPEGKLDVRDGGKREISRGNVRRGKATCIKRVDLDGLPGTQWVLFKVSTKNSQCGSIFPQFLKEPIEDMVGYIVITLMVPF